MQGLPLALALTPASSPLTLRSLATSAGALELRRRRDPTLHREEALAEFPDAYVT